MTVFIDTSAICAALYLRDERSEAAGKAWSELSGRNEALVTTNYVLLEALSLLQRRLGHQVVRDFQTDFVPLLQVTWVDAVLHKRAVAAFLTAGRRDLSLVDCVSFEVMRQLSLDTAFAFDEHFRQQGFRCVP